MSDERHIRDRSLWLDTFPGPIRPRPALQGDTDCDVAIVGAGMTGLWTAYALLDADPSLRVRVIEREVAGFGASGRNGGWVSAGIAGVAEEWAKHSGAEAVRQAERATWESVDWIGERVAQEQIDCGFVKGASSALRGLRRRKNASAPTSIITASGVGAKTMCVR